MGKLRLYYTPKPSHFEIITAALQPHISKDLILSHLFLAGVCYATAAHGDTHDDAQLLLHDAEPAAPRHPSVSGLHPPVLTCTRPPTPATSQPSRRSQQPPRPRLQHAVVLLLVPQRNAAAAATTADDAAAKVSSSPETLILFSMIQ